MRPLLAAFSVLLLAGAGGFVAVCSLSRPKEAYLTAEVVRGFDADRVEPPRPPAAPAAPAPLPRGAWPYGKGPGTAETDSSFRGAAAPMAPSAPERPPGALDLSRRAPAARVEANLNFQTLMAAPVKFMARRTLLGKPESFEGFLRDQARVSRYLQHPLIRGVLENPALLRSFLSQPAVVEGFLASPAMRDRRAVSALASSSLLRELVNSKGVRAVLEDPAFVERLVANPRTVSWLAQNPRALGALSEFGPALASAGALSLR